jgi:hypothetical protein
VSRVEGIRHGGSPRVVATVLLLVCAPSALWAQYSRGVMLEPFFATQIVPGDHPSSYAGDGCGIGWSRLSTRVGWRATHAPTRRIPRLLLDASLSFSVSGASDDCLSIPRPTQPLPGTPLRYAVGLGNGGGGFGLLRMGLRALEQRSVRAVIGAGVGGMTGVSHPFFTGGGHMEIGRPAIRGTVGLDWFALRVPVRTETLVQLGDQSRVRRVETPHTLRGSLLRIGVAWRAQ